MSAAGLVHPARWASLDAVRAALALAVLGYHLGGTIALDKYFGFDLFAKLFGFGGARVPFFFVLSGFLLTLLHGSDMGQPTRAADFLRRRILRIYPSYWIILTAVVLATLAMPDLRAKVPTNPEVIARMLLLLPQDKSVAGPTGAPLIIVAWTLHFEVAFYLLVALFMLGRIWLILACLALAGNALACTDGACGPFRSLLANPYLAHFGVGAAAAFLSTQLPPLRQARALAALGIGAFVLLALTVEGRVDIRQMSDPNIYYALLAATILLCLVNADAQRGHHDGAPLAVPRLKGWIRVLGDSSYALYLLHFPMVSILCRLFVAAGFSGAWGATVAAVVIVVVCVGSAVAFHRWIERPLTRWLTRVSYRGTGRAPGAEARA